MQSRRERLRWAIRVVREPNLLHVHPGHPYSPIPSPEDVARAVSTDGPGRREVPGVDLRDDEQWALLQEVLPLATDTATWLASGDRRRFTLDNTWFTGSDALFYATFLRHLRPARVVEVGAGYSSALALDVDEAFLGGATRFTFVEPDATRLRSVVRANDLGGRLIEGVAQDVPPDVFAALGAGDFLMIDSSHVLRAGSDVQHLLFEVFPSLAPGVVVHIHDVFHPFEYPPSWLARGVALNEAYAVRALLQDSGRVRIVLWNHYLERFHRDWFAEHLPLCTTAPIATGGIWLRIGD